MQQKRRFTRPVVVTICLSLLALVAMASVLTWHVLTQPPTPPQASCGTIDLPQDQASRPHLQQIEDCFSRAYQQCTAMTMQVIQQGTDTGDTTIYWPQKQGNACQIFAESTSFSPIRGDTNSTETCQGVIPKNGGLLVQRCSTSGDVFIPG